MVAPRKKHPITTPKGTALLTVILAVIGVFTPFFTSLQAAQLFAIVAVLIIAWIYWPEAEALKYPRRRKNAQKALILPGVAIVIIASVAIGATWIVNTRTSAPPPPALTADDVARAVGEAVGRANPKSEVQKPPPVQETYRIVVEEAPPLPAPAPLSKPSPTAKFLKPEDVLGDTIKRSRRSSARFNAELACSSQYGAVRTEMLVLISRAVQYQNAYYYGRDDKLIVDNYNKWSSDVKNLFEQHKSKLPTYQIVELAQGQKANNFLGIHNSGDTAWGNLDAKSKVLQIISSDMGQAECKAVGAVAVEKCEADKTC